MPLPAAARAACGSCSPEVLTALPPLTPCLTTRSACLDRISRSIPVASTAGYLRHRYISTLLALGDSPTKIGVLLPDMPTWRATRSRTPRRRLTGASAGTCRSFTVVTKSLDNEPGHSAPRRSVPALSRRDRSSLNLVAQLRRNRYQRVAWSFDRSIPAGIGPCRLREGRAPRLGERHDERGTVLNYSCLFRIHRPCEPCRSSKANAQPLFFLSPHHACDVTEYSHPPDRRTHLVQGASEFRCTARKRCALAIHGFH